MTWTVGASAGNPDMRKLVKPAPVALGNPDQRRASTTTEANAAEQNTTTAPAADTLTPTPETEAMGNPDQRTPAPKRNDARRWLASATTAT